MDLSQIKQIPIVEVARRLGIKVKGTKAMCFSGHDKNTPSLSFYEKNNTWRCFGACGKGGDAISLVEEYLEVDFLAAVKWFECYGIYQSKVNKIVKPKKIIKVQDTAVDFKMEPDNEIYEWLISKCGMVSDRLGLDYLKQHAISLDKVIEYSVKELKHPRRAKEALIERWGYSRVVESGLINETKHNSNYLIWYGYCLLFPFFDNDMITYIQARLFSGRAKYINPKGIQKPLYNRNMLSNIKRGSRVHICEGIPDALAMESSNLNAVAVLGATSFKREWVSDFRDYEVVIVPDGDEGGNSFAKKITAMFNSEGVPVQRLLLPKGKDASDILAEIGRDIERT